MNLVSRQQNLQILHLSCNQLNEVHHYLHPDPRLSRYSNHLLVNTKNLHIIKDKGQAKFHKLQCTTVPLYFYEVFHGLF